MDEGPSYKPGSQAHSRHSNSQFAGSLDVVVACVIYPRAT